MLEEKQLNTFVKLNPTLLGYPRVREILDTCGFDYIGLNEESFEHDLKIGQALEMLTRLMALAKSKQLGFGVKLTNTLGTVNNKGALPGDEMYMSGRALFRSPSTLRRCSRVNSTANSRSPTPAAPASSIFAISLKPGSAPLPWRPIC